MKKVLVVEDSFEIRLALQISLSQMGCQVIAAVDGNDGLQKFEEHQPALVVLDLRMPGLDGSQVCKAIRRSSAVPVIVFSALDQHDEVKKAIDAGASAFVLKSTGLDELLKRVHTLLVPKESSKSKDDSVVSARIQSRSPRLQVVVLDPDPSTARTLINETEKLGHSVQKIRALDPGEPPMTADVVVIDYAIPKRIGIDMVEAMSKASRSRPLGLIVASRANPPEQRSRLRKCLLLDFIQKPWQSWEVPLRLSTAYDLYARRMKLSA